MRAHVSLTSDVHGPRGFIVDDATQADIAEWQRAARDEPDTTLDFPRARLHLGVEQTGRASCRAGDIITIRPI